MKEKLKEKKRDILSLTDAPKNQMKTYILAVDGGDSKVQVAYDVLNWN